MDVEKLFSDLESNHTHESEEAKKKLVELFSQYKEQWVVQYMMDYFTKTGSQRIMEVLVKVQSPHDGYIFDRLAEWLKTQPHRVDALKLFFFVVRKHPSWLFKVEKHRLIKDIFKLLLAEKEIVPLMTALLCMIALLPIIPNSVPNFLNDLFDVFGHLASWNCQNPNRLSDDKLVYLQLGLQMFFHLLYGMYPCNFLNYLSEFIKKEKGAIFYHTIKPLLETVRVHPMLVLATAESEMSNARWKEKEPHDVVEECAKHSLPATHQDINAELLHQIDTSDLMDTPSLPRSTPSIMHTNTSFSKTTIAQRNFTYRVADTHYPIGVRRSGDGDDTIWSPYHEIVTSGPMPLTPTSFMLTAPATTATVNQLLGVTGSSPPEAAVEATPETTPMKDIKEPKHGSTLVANPHAVRAIFANSQPSSPMRKDQNQFNFTEVTRASTTFDRRLQQVIHDRTRSQSPFQTIEAVSAKQQMSGYRSPLDCDSKCDTPELDAEVSSSIQAHALTHNLPTIYGSMQTPTPTATSLPTSTPVPTPTLTPSQAPTSVEHITKICDDCNESERSKCTAGGLHMPTSSSMQLMLMSGLRRRNRMTSYNESSCMRLKDGSRRDNAIDSYCMMTEVVEVRRTKSCSALCLTKTSKSFGIDDEKKALPSDRRGLAGHVSDHPLQKSGRMLAIPTVTKKALATLSSVSSPFIVGKNAATQTVEIVPQSYESKLIEILQESADLRNAHERNLRYPQKILDQFILNTVLCREFADKTVADTHPSSFLSQEQYQLLHLQLQYERYRREIHAERNRRLMGRSRDKRSLEMERDLLREQLFNFTVKNRELMDQIDKSTKKTNEREQMLVDDLTALKLKYQYEVEQNKCLRQANENLQTRLNEELANRRDGDYELESLRGQIFDFKAELAHTQVQAEMGLRYKQELSRLEAEFIVMGEVQVKCRDRFSELDNYRARDQEFQMLQENYSIELKELRHAAEDRTAQVDSAKHKIAELQAQLINSEKVITEQKRKLKAVKDEYEEKFKSLNKKYDVQKIISMQMEEKIIMLMSKSQTAHALNTCSPDTDKTDVASSMDRNSPLSTSLASSESLSASIRSTELRNLHQLVETPIAEASGSSISVIGMGAGPSIIEGKRLPAPDLAASASTANTMSMTAGAINIMPTALSSSAAAAEHNYDLPSTSTLIHTHPHAHLQHTHSQQQQQKHAQTKQQKR